MSQLIRDLLSFRLALHQWSKPFVRLLSTPATQSREWTLHIECAVRNFDKRPTVWLTHWGPLLLADPDTYTGLCAICMKRLVTQ